MTRSTRILFVFLFVLITSFISCQIGMTLRIEGVVTDATNNSPINGVRVNLVYPGFLSSPPKIKSTAKTDLEGRYFIEYSRSRSRYCGSFNLTVSALGYMSKTYIEAVRCIEDVQTFDFKLVPSSWPASLKSIQ